MDQARHYDAVVIGAGQGGIPLAMALARAGRTTALIEREHVGGTCINEGCTPTKTMVASARVAYLARRAADYGVHAGPVAVDMAAVRQRTRAIVQSFRTGSERRIAQTEGLDLLRGEACFTGPASLAVRGADGTPRRGAVITAPTIVINTGARPSVPALEGIAAVPVLDSTSIMEVDAVPSHLLVLGGGYVGLEFGQMFRRFGSAVTIVQRGAQLLAREDTDVADAVAALLREDGVEILLETAAQRVARSAMPEAGEARGAVAASGASGGAIALTVRTPEGERTVEGSHLLVAAGRTPNTEALHLEAAGVQTDKRGFVRVDERLETTVPGIYGLGDVAGSPAFTHISYDDFRILRANLIEGRPATTRDRLVPYTVFIDPQLGRVGLSEDEARRQGRNVRVARMSMSSVARALEVDESRGFMKAVVDADSGQILGCAVLGLEGGELMAMLEIAMLGRLPYTALRDAVFAHPTLAESLNNLFATLDA